MAGKEKANIFRKRPDKSFSYCANINHILRKYKDFSQWLY
jgi:hypothetical protein